jgi:hypothetical protein
MPQLDGDGLSLLSLINGDEKGHRLSYCETYFREERSLTLPDNRPLRPLKALRVDDRLKVIWEVGSDGAQAYDLANDPLEMHPLNFGDGSSFGLPPV